MPAPLPSRWPPSRAVLVGCLVLAAVAAGVRGGPVARAQMVPATLLTVAADTPVPAQPTSVPPTKAPATPTRVRDGGGAEHEEPAQPGGAPGQGASPAAPTEGPSPTRTRRPTRTPRTTATATPTPMVAGGLAMRLYSEPSVLVRGRRAVLVVELENRTASRAENLTLQVELPASVLVDAVKGEPGLASRSGSLVRWYLPGLEPGAVERLELSGLVARAPVEGAPLCALMLTGGHPLQVCAVIASSGDQGAAMATPEEVVEPTPASGGAADAGAALDRGTLGLGVLMLGLGILGIALGLRRPTRASGDDAGGQSKAPDTLPPGSGSG